MNYPIPIPSDSFLHSWVTQWENTEVPISWRIITGLAIVGVVLKRSAWYDQGETGKIYPNLSVMLVGPSGYGKDTILDPASQVMDTCGAIQIVGKTIEAAKQSLRNLGNPAVGYILAPELAEFLGGKDYQSGIIEGLTDLLSNKFRADISLKADVAKGDRVFIHRPTITMLTGTTQEWLQGNLPKGALEGGFLPRFVIVPEESKKGIAPVADPGEYESHTQRSRILLARETFLAEVSSVAVWFAGCPTGFVQTNGVDNARDYYRNWYENRYKKFSHTLQSYAPRAAGLMRRLALLMAVTRGKNYIGEEDYHFADAVISYTAERLEGAVVPASPEVSTGNAVLKLLIVGRPHSYILRTLAPKYGVTWVKRGISYLIETNQARMVEGNLIKEEE